MWLGMYVVRYVCMYVCMYVGRRNVLLVLVVSGEWIEKREHQPTLPAYLHIGRLQVDSHGPHVNNKP